MGHLARITAIACIALAAAAEEYRPGGKLAGVVLPLYKTHHGEAAGYPGCIPELAVAAALKDENNDGKPDVRFVPQGMAPKEELYPGSVEHWSAYWFKYLPVHSMFDRQSLLKNWRATELPAAKGRVEAYAEPVYWLIRHGTAQPTGRSNPPVDVVRSAPGGAAFSVAAGALEPGLYCARIIGAVETAKIQRHRLPLYIAMTVNDGVDGSSTTYRMRCPYVDEFYSVAEFYFHAPEHRDYTISFAIDAESKVDLLVYNLDLHDALAGCDRRAIKQRRTLNAQRQAPTLQEAQPLANADMLWHAFPPLNAHTRFVYGMGSNDSKGNWPDVGAAGKTPAAIAEEHGSWEWKRQKLDGPILVNKKLNLSYSLADYRAGKPLPDPYPFKDRGQGVWTAPAEAGGKPQNLWPVPEGIGRRMRAYSADLNRHASLYLNKGDLAAGRRAAFMLVRLAYSLPAIEARHSMHSVLVQPGSWGRDHGNRRRDPQRSELGTGIAYCNTYDSLFDLIRSDTELATAVRAYVPSVKTPADVTALLDTYLVQTIAKRILRYQMYASNTPEWILTPANCLGDPEFTRPWLEWLFSAAFIYPLPPAGIQDLITSANDRHGMGYIASHYYSHGEQAAKVAAKLDVYIRHGGLETYNLGDPTRYPKPLAACHWFFDSRTAGNYFPRIGDVCGPDKGYGHPLVHQRYKSLIAQSARGWKWSRNPKFAWALAQYDDAKKWGDQWQQITAAAATVKRAPWYDNRSRVLTNWGGFLESGVEFDDDRYRRSLMIRVGQGWGHHHNDAMDLQLHALGYPMTIDGGQRPGYGNPSDRSTITHNLVIIDGKEWLGHAWITTLSDAEDAGYMRAQAEPPRSHPEVQHYSRQAALIDVDEGAATAAAIPESRKFPKTAPAANSYVFDVQRVVGGSQHAHAFHAMIEDELACNVENRSGLAELTGEAAELARRFPSDVEGLPRSDAGFAGTAPAVLQATWRMNRTKQGHALTEERMHKAIWDPEGPRKYTRLHLLGQQGAPVFSGYNHCRQWKYGWTSIQTMRQGADAKLESVFPALIEPYAGEPIIVDRQLLEIPDNDTDAQRAVAVAVKTRQGHSDILFADGRPEKERTVGDLTVSAEFAFISRDETGVRVATVTGGRLAAPDVVLTPAAALLTGTVTATDYGARSLQLDSAWPAPQLLAGQVFEVGVAGHWTTYTTAAAAAAEGGTRLTMTEGAQFYLSRVSKVDEAAQIVTCGLGFTHNEKHPNPGVDRHWVASTEDGSRFWRAQYLGDPAGLSRYSFKLDGPVTAAAFAGGKGLALWEYGAGDTVRLRAAAGLRRVRKGVYRMTANVPVTVALRGTSLEWSADGQSWQAVPSASREAGLVRAELSADMLAAGGRLAWLRVQ
jgi:hypothetical protein